jgi:hypothetical protein
VLKDGADSVGILGALNRVYLNIGLFSEEWTLHFRPIFGARRISPIKISDAVKHSAYWGATEDQTADMAIFFLVTATPDKLKDAPGGEPWLSTDQTQLARGKVVFADHCAACNSSKIPEAPEEAGVDSGFCAGGGNGPHYRECWDRYWGWVQTEEFKREMRKKVNAPDFLDNNFLSTERRVPVDLLETNACSPLATNALAGDIWDNFSSSSYKQLPPVRELSVHHPVSGGVSAFQPLGAGRGYTRPASLVSLWSTAPFLLNNSIGHEDYRYTASSGYSSPDYKTDKAYPAYGDKSRDGGYGGGYGYENRCPAANDKDPYLPCVDNRMHVFNDSITKMLYPERRRVDGYTMLPVPGYIYRTTAPSCLRIPNGYLPDILREHSGFLRKLLPWVFDEQGDIALGPLPAGFPVNVLAGVKLLPDRDEPGGLSHLWSLVKAGPTLLSTFKQLGGACSEEELTEPVTQVHAERVLQDTGLIDTLVGLSKCLDYVVNRGHYFGAELSDADKTALIEYLKYF